MNQVCLTKYQDVARQNQDEVGPRLPAILPPSQENKSFPCFRIETTLGNIGPLGNVPPPPQQKIILSILGSKQQWEALDPWVMFPLSPEKWEVGFRVTVTF